MALSETSELLEIRPTGRNSSHWPKTLGQVLPGTVCCYPGEERGSPWAPDTKVPLSPLQAWHHH